MRDLFRAEARRMRPLAVLYAAAHLGVLIFLMRVADLLQQPLLVYRLAGAVHLLAGLALGAWQLRAYSGRPSAWLYLLHRPLAPWRIAIAVLGAGATAALFAVVVPMALGLAAQRGLTVRVVDLRHLALPLAGGLLALAGYLAGALLAIAPRRRAPAPIVLLAWLAAAQASGPRYLLVALIVAGWLAALAVLAFRPDVDEVPRSPLALAALIAPMAAAWSIALSVASLVFHLGWIAVGNHPNNRVVPMAGGHVEVTRGEARAVLLRGLADLRTDEAAVMRGQVELSEALTLRAAYEELPRRHDLTNPAPPEFTDADGLRWVFSHDELRFIGMDPESLVRKGALAGNDGFRSPPLVEGDQIVERGVVRTLDGPEHRLRVLARLPDGEVLAGPPAALGQAMVALGSRSLVIFDARDVARTTEPLPVIERVALPAPIGSLLRVDLIELLDGYLISIVSGNDNPNGKAVGQQWTLRVEHGATRVLTRRELIPDYPALSRLRARWSAPLLEHVRRRALALGAGAQPLREAPEAPMGGAMIALAAGLMVLAGAWTAVRARRLGRSQAWAVAALVLGWPLALAFALVVPAPWTSSGSRTKRTRRRAAPDPRAPAASRAP